MYGIWLLEATRCSPTLCTCPTTRCRPSGGYLIVYFGWKMLYQHELKYQLLRWVEKEETQRKVLGEVTLFQLKKRISCTGMVLWSCLTHCDVTYLSSLLFEMSSCVIRAPKVALLQHVSCLRFHLITAWPSCVRPHEECQVWRTGWPGLRASTTNPSVSTAPIVIFCDLQTEVRRRAVMLQPHVPFLSIHH
jgi:hypothetical protein